MRRRRLFTAFLLLAVVPATASGQSLFATRGMGLPLAPVDARARALGGMGIGLLGLSTSLVNPAELAGLTRRGIVAVLQSGSAAPSVAGEKGDIDAARFPLVRLIFPFGRVVTSLGYGSSLEQSWGIQRSGRDLVGSDSIDVLDVVESTGGLSRIVLAAGIPLSPTFAVGAEIGLHAGVLDRSIRRSFPDTASTLNPFETRYRWGYEGPVATLGARWDPRSGVRLGAAVTLSGHVDVEGRTPESRDDRFRPPLRVAAGGSAWLSSLWLATAAVEWSGRGGDAETVFGSSDAIGVRRDAWHVGGGLEYHGVRSGQRSIPFRLGASYLQLPFYDLGEEPASEWAGTLGTGFRLAGDEANPLAVADLAFERGRRSGLSSAALPDGLRESYWRFTVTLSLFGN
jgi:hypothetical protein